MCHHIIFRGGMTTSEMDTAHNQADKPQHWSFKWLHGAQTPSITLILLEYWQSSFVSPTLIKISCCCDGCWHMGSISIYLALKKLKHYNTLGIKMGVWWLMRASSDFLTPVWMKLAEYQLDDEACAELPSSWQENSVCRSVINYWL